MSWHPYFFEQIINKQYMRNFVFIGFILYICTAGVFANPLSETETAENLNCDFSQGIPEGFALYDMDRNDVSVDMEMIGFETGKAWIPYTIEDNNNTVACSTSWYKSAGTSNDWMVTTPVRISGKSAVLKWKAMAFDKNFRDGYNVYISDSGNRTEDFDVSKPAFSVKEEESVWTEHNVSLAEYEGKTVWVAFVNNSTDCSRLYIDDLFIGEPAVVDITANIPEVVNKPGEISVEGEVFTALDKPVKGLSIGFSYGEKVYTEDFPDMTLEPGKRIPFKLKEGINIDDNETINYQIWVEHDGLQKKQEKTVSAYTRAIVVEETTGTWCGWCIRGIVILDKMKKEYPDSFIGIAVHSGDVMTDEYYDKALLEYMSNDGWPYCIINRNEKYKGDPNIITWGYETLAAEPSEVGIGIETNMSEDKTIKVSTSLYFVEDRDNLNYRLAYVITENNVHDPTNDEYSQQNYYAGKEEKMGGYENMPAVIPAADMYYQDVARAIIGGFEGVEGSVPASVKAHVPAEYEYTLAMPENVMNPEETELVVLLLDNASGRIVNGRKVSLRELYAADHVYADSSDMLDVSHEGSELHVSATQGKSCSVALYDTCGRLIYTGSAVHHVIPTDGMKGVFVLRADDGTKVCSLKVVM